jgi:hypothetical protein
MKKLEDISKKNFFEVPEGYFDDLPGIIQARIAHQKPLPAWRLSWAPTWRYALPVTVLVAAGIFWFKSSSISIPSTADVEAELSSVPPSQLAIYLDDHELTTEDLVETVTWSADDLNDLENSVYAAFDVSHQEIEKILNEYNDVEL